MYKEYIRISSLNKVVFKYDLKIISKSYYIYYMEPFLIICLVLTCGLIIERIINHFHKSTCCGSSIEFNDNVEVPKYPNMIDKL